MDDAICATTQGRSRTPAHLWIVGVLSLLWNAVGATDYTMTEMRNAAYLKMMTPAQMAWIDSFPAWAIGAWALGVWGAMVGSLLLLLRSRHAVTAFIVSLVGVFGTTLYQYVIAPPAGEPQSSSGLTMSAAIWAIAIALLVYARAMRARGVLR